MDERKLEIRVGALLLAAVAGLLGLLWMMGELQVGRGSALTVDFSHTGNVVQGAPVKLSGVQVGRVQRVVLKADRRDDKGMPLPVQMELSVDEGALAALRKDARVTVSSQGPLGESYLELNPGLLADQPLPRGTAIRGVDAPRIDLVTNRLSTFLEAATRVLERDPEAFASLVTGVSKLADTLDVMLNENRSNIRAISGEMSGTAEDLRHLVATLHETLKPGGKGAQILDDVGDVAKTLRRDLPQLSSNASKTLHGLAEVTGELTPEDGKRVRVMLERYSAAGEKLDLLAARAERLLNKVEAGEGTLGAVMKDPQVYQDLKALVSDLKAHPWKVLWKSD